MLVPVDTEQFQKEIKNDFETHAEGSIYFFTEKMADEYIKKATVESIKEVLAIENGTFFTDEKQSAWNSKR